MNQKIKKTPYMLRYGFEYKPEVIEKYGNIFSLDNIANYSSKIHSICQSIKKSKGIIFGEFNKNTFYRYIFIGTVYIGKIGADGPAPSILSLRSFTDNDTLLIN